MLRPVAADRAPKKGGEGGGSKLGKDLRRKGWMHYAVVVGVREGRMSRRDVVEDAVVVAAEALVSDQTAADFAFAASRRLS